MVEVVVIDTHTGRADKVFKQLMNVRQAAWSRDGARLALLTTSEIAEQPAGHDRLGLGRGRARTLAEVPRRPVRRSPRTRS